MSGKGTLQIQYCIHHNPYKILEKRNKMLTIQAFSSIFAGISELMDTARIQYHESDLDFASTPVRFRCGIIILCTCGEGKVSTGAQEYRLEHGSCLIFVTGTILSAYDKTTDFRVRILTFSKEVFLESVRVLDTQFFNRLHDSNYLTDLGKDPETYRRTAMWMDMASLLPDTETPRLRELSETNFLQNLFIWMSGSPGTGSVDLYGHSRKQQLCHRFLNLVHEYSTEHHDVAFYAQELCITARYLNATVSEHVDGKTPKQIIDEQLTAELKVLLNDTDLTISEIASRTGFCDQTYMSSFFKKNTGLSPRDYRKTLIGRKSRNPVPEE